jgi:hypothetical protein
MLNEIKFSDAAKMSEKYCKLVEQLTRRNFHFSKKHENFGSIKKRDASIGRGKKRKKMS